MMFFFIAFDQIAEHIQIIALAGIEPERDVPRPAGKLADSIEKLGAATFVPALALGPIGLGGMMHGDGEILACRAAQAMGIPYTLSTMSINSIEDVAGAVEKPFWFQLYVMRDREFADVLNGIAYDPVGRRLIVTGKQWARMYEIAIPKP